MCGAFRAKNSRNFARESHVFAGQPKDGGAVGAGNLQKKSKNVVKILVNCREGKEEFEWIYACIKHVCECM